MSNIPRCLVRGSLNIDEFFLLPSIVEPGETISSTDFFKKAGGKGANQAYALARAGGPVDLDGCVGPDGSWVLEMLKEGGVGVDRCKVVNDKVTGRAIIQRAEDGENAIVLHKGANYHIPPTDSNPDLSGYSHLLVQNEIPFDSTIAYLESAATLGITSILNPSPMPTPGQLSKFNWQKLSWLIVNEGELFRLLDALDVNDDPTVIPPSQTPTSRASMALDRFKQISQTTGVIVTLGADGLVYLDPKTQQKEHVPAAKLQNPLKDTTGAGDCFAGYFTTGLMAAEGESSLKSILEICLTACAICVEVEGAMESVPLGADTLARLSS